jgi:hypothetical protein
MKAIHSYLLLVTAFAIGLLAQAASAQTATWNAASGNWSTALNWSPPVDPNGNSFNVIFNNGGSLTLDSARFVGTYSQTGGTFTITNGQFLQISSAGALDGGGVISLATINDALSGINTSSVVLTNSTGTLRGSGQIGYSNLSVLNQANGIIQADVSGQLLYLNGSGTFTNNGLMRAQGGGTLILDGSSAGVFNNNATIRSENSSNVSILFSKLVGGTLDNTGSSGAITLNNGTLRDVTIAAGSTVTTGATASGSIENTLINRGTLAPTDPQGIFVASNTTLSGGGVIALASLNSVITNTGSDRTLTNSDNLIRGTGQIGYDSLSVVNSAAGIIQADVSGQTLSLDGSGTFTNNGLMRAQNGGTLLLDGSSAGVFNNNATVRSENGSDVSILFSKIVGGTLDNTGSTGTLTLNNGTIRDVTIAAGSTVTTGATRPGTIENTLINRGTLAPNAAQGIFVASNTTLSGGGVIVLASLNSVITNTGSNRTLTNSDNLIRGTGQIGYDSLSMVNSAAGIIQADVAGQSLLLNGSGTFTNNGLMLASNGATLYFSGTGAITNSGGTLHVLATSLIKGDGGITQTAGTIDLDGGNMNFPLGVDLNGGQLIGNGTFTGPIRNDGGIVGPGHSPGKITLTGDYTQGATGTLNIEIGGTTAGTGYDQLVVSGIATLGGTLSITAINGFQPAVGDVYTLITAGSFSGSFATININGFTGKIDSSTNGITLTVTTVSSQLLNISTRLNVLTGDNVLIGGFIITGTTPKQVIVRAIGPSLGAFGVVGALADPVLELHLPDSSVVTNDNWRSTQEQEIIDSNLAPTDDLESAILATLPPGSYTAIVSGNNGGTGVGLVEAYDLDQAAGQLANISTRGFVDTDDNVMIGGFIVGGGSDGITATVLVRAIGPSLTDFGVPGALQDPTLELHDGSGNTLMANDNWKDDQEAAIAATTLQPTNDLESAILATLPTGAYTAIVRGQNNTTGVGLVEAYNLQ